MDEEHDYDFICNTTALEQRDILCQIYRNQLASLSEIALVQVESNEKLIIIFPFSPVIDITVRFLGGRSVLNLLETMKNVCPWTFRVKS